MTSPQGRKKDTRPLRSPTRVLECAREAAGRLRPDELRQKLISATKHAQKNGNIAMQVFLTQFARSDANKESQRSSARQGEKQGSSERPDEQVKQVQAHEQNTVVDCVKESRRRVNVLQRDERRAKKKRVRTERAKLVEKQCSGGEKEAAAQPGEFETSLSSPFAPPLTFSGPAEAADDEPIRITYSVRPVLPVWYTSITESSSKMKQYGKKRPQEVTALDALKDCISRCEAETHESKLHTLHDELRDHVHKANASLHVDKYMLKKTRILSEIGLPRIFRDEADFPWDLKADAYQVYNRWCRGELDNDLLRGVKPVKGKDRNGDRLDKAYREKYPTNPKSYGQGDLVLGQWWPTQICTLRDGSHGNTQAGMCCVQSSCLASLAHGGVYSSFLIHSLPQVSSAKPTKAHTQSCSVEAGTTT